jgi:hypothetical protein
LGPRRPPNVHDSRGSAWASAGIAAAERLRGPLSRRPPSVHGSLDRERVEEQDGVLATVAREVTVVVVIIAMLEPMKRETANTETPARSAKVA